MPVNYIHTEAIHNTTAANEVLPYLFNLVKPRSVIDIGCGTGTWLKVAKECGANKILGIDGIHVDKTMLRIGQMEFLQHNLTHPLSLDVKYDLAICLEVAEHLPENSADNLVSILTGSSDIILFSAGIPNQGGQYHVNEQWPVYWQQKFANYGFLPFDVLREKFWENQQVEWWYKQNMLLYIRTGAGKEHGLTPISKIPVYIHPELLSLKAEQLANAGEANANLERIINEEVTNPKFYPALRKLVKSIIK